MAEDEYLLHETGNNMLSERDRSALSSLAEHYGKDTSGPCCQKFRLVSRAENVITEEKIIYAAFLCTLVEERWTVQKTFPYNGNEICPGDPIGDIWHDYEFDTPQITVLKTPQLCVSKDLNHTQRREECSQCRDNREDKCSQCKGKHSVFIRTQLNVKWSNHKSNPFYPPGDESLYSQLKLQEFSNKIKCVDFDDIWPSDERSLNSIFNRCNGLPEDLKNDLNRKFLTQSSSTIRRLKCLIERVGVVKISYQLKGLKGKEMKINFLQIFYLYYLR